MLTVLSETPPPNFFRPPYCGTNGSIIAVEADINYANLPSLAKPTGVTWPASLSTLGVHEKLSRVWVETNTEYTGEYVRASSNQPSYGRDMARRTEAAMLYACLDYSNEQKREVLLGLIQYAIDLYGAIAAPSNAHWTANGGHNMGRKAILLFAGRVLGKQEFIDVVDPNTWLRFQEDETAFYVNSSAVSRTQNNSLGSGAWDPDVRSPSRPLRYNTTMVNMPEWGIRHATVPAQDNGHWAATYRTISYNHLVGHALVMHLLGLVEEWNFPAFFDYIDRYVFVEVTRGALGGATNDIQLRTLAMWNAYRTLPLHSEVWGSVGQIPTVVSSPDVTRTVESGAGTTFSVSAVGIPAPSFQWKKGDIPISGATSAQLTLAAVTGGDAGAYSCDVANTFGVVSTYPTVLTVTGTDPVDTTPPSWLTLPSVSGITETGAELRGMINESGTIYWVLLADGVDAPTSPQVEAGTGGIAAGSAAVTASVLAALPISGGTAGIPRDLFVVAKDVAGNRQATPVKVDITFAAVEEPPPEAGPAIGARRRPGAKLIVQ